MTLNVQDVHRWLAHISAVAYGSLSLSMAFSGNTDQVHFKTRKLVLASVAAFVKTPAFPPNLIIHWIEVA